MSEPPRFLTPDVAATFGDVQVAGSYRHRPVYPPQTFAVLTELIADVPRAVLDLGCGTGLVARPLAPLVDRVDAVDVSRAMIEEGKHLPGGDDPRLTWIVGEAETAVLQPPYALVTAGDSLHWMKWEVVLPRLAEALTPAGRLAVLTLNSRLAARDEALRDGITDLIKRYTTLDDWRPDFDLVAELEARSLFREEGRTTTDSMSFRQPVDHYVESYHARASLSWERMEPQAIAGFDTELRRLVLSRIGDQVELEVSATVVWGKPLQS